MIPQNCIDIFIKRFEQYPSSFEIDINVDLMEKVSGYVDKFTTLWFRYSYDYITNKNVLEERLCEYDPVGILIYQNKGNKLFILTRGDRKNASEYLINLIRKIK